MSDWVEFNGDLVCISKYKRIKKPYPSNFGGYSVAFFDHENKDAYISYFASKKEACKAYDNLKAKLMPEQKTIHNDYGPDNVSTPDDIAETNELESLRGAIEDAMNIIIQFNKDKEIKLKYHLDFLIKEIERTLKPFC